MNFEAKRPLNAETKRPQKFGWKKLAPLLMIVVSLVVLTQKRPPAAERFHFEAMDKKLIAMEGEPSWGLAAVSGKLDKGDDLFLKETEFSYDEKAAPHVEKQIDEDWVSYPVAKNAQLYIVSFYEDAEVQTIFKRASLKELKSHIEEYEKSKANETIPFSYFLKDGEIIFLAEQYVS